MDHGNAKVIEDHMYYGCKKSTLASLCLNFTFDVGSLRSCSFRQQTQRLALAPRAKLGMQPPVIGLKALPPPRQSPVPPSPSPQTPSSSAPSTPQVSGEPPLPEGPPKKKGKGEPKKRAAKDLAACSPLERGENLCTQILKKKGDCAELETQIKTLQFGAGLAQELQKFQVRFESAPQVCDLMFAIRLISCFSF